MAPTVLLLHGFTNTGASWDPVVAALAQRYRAIAPDLRGHGSASAARPVTLEAVIGDIAALAPDRFTLAGYSQGGRIALHAALALGPRVERLVLIGASPGIADPAARAARRAADEALAAEIEGETIEEFANRWAATPVLAGQPREVSEPAHADRLKSTPSGLAAALRGLGTGALPSLWERLPDLRIPVTMIVGERDEKFRALGEEMARALPRGDLVVVPRAGHAVHLEAPERVAAELLAGGEFDEVGGSDR
jgi:2-succinyl-6-hydroxy-2,4-cyclohexadiene-1-carboxylate synthase